MEGWLESTKVSTPTARKDHMHDDDPTAYSHGSEPVRTHTHATIPKTNAFHYVMGGRTPNV